MKQKMISLTYVEKKLVFTSWETKVGKGSRGVGGKGIL